MSTELTDPLAHFNLQMFRHHSRSLGDAKPAGSPLVTFGVSQASFHSRHTRTAIWRQQASCDPRVAGSLTQVLFVSHAHQEKQDPEHATLFILTQDRPRGRAPPVTTKSVRAGVTSPPTRKRRRTSTPAQQALLRGQQAPVQPVQRQPRRTSAGVPPRRTSAGVPRKPNAPAAATMSGSGVAGGPAAAAAPGTKINQIENHLSDYFEAVASWTGEPELREEREPPSLNGCHKTAN